MPRRLRASAVLLSPIVAALLLAPGASATDAPKVPSAAPAKSGPSAQNGCGNPPALRPYTFPARPKVNNKFLPLKPGTRLVLTGDVAGEDHTVVTTVTDLTKVIDGVRTVVVFDQDFNGDEIQESELAFFAQDRRGTVWRLGEYPEIYENGRLTGAPDTWISGVEGAKAGIAMLARPRVGTPTYTEGLAPEIDFLDCATVVQTGQSVCVEAGCFENVLVTDEFAPLDPEGGHQLKSYAPHVGNIKVEPVGEENPETLSLTEFTRLGREELAAVREEVLEQDARGYEISPDVYGTTPPAKPARASVLPVLP
ncbi:hypothetical protein [Streptomyces sp. NK15101]|uniref:hypothetical protein n=1 Tax=Streptomyces sp. NK15101 TaxID=2873261 RepID=UPI001CED2964|nr:hypothetical protein [Streptomyces sp. NK15101]